MFSLVAVPRFVPANILMHPTEFGRTWVAWTVPNRGLSLGDVAWAIYQHRVSYFVLSQLASDPDPRTAMQTMAERFGASPSWLRRKLHGRAPATLGEMAGWLMYLGIEAPALEPAIDAALALFSPNDGDPQDPSTTLSPLELSELREWLRKRGRQL